MQINLSEKLRTLSEACRIIPGRPSRSSIERWRLRGLHGVRLETILVGSRRFTSDEAIERFCRAVTIAADGEAPPSDPDRAASIEKAEQFLAANGV